jgi:hypothetical protein
MAANNVRTPMVFEAYGIPLQGPPEQAEAMGIRAQYLASILPDSFSVGRFALYVTDYEPSQPEFGDLYGWVRGDQR